MAEQKRAGKPQKLGKPLKRESVKTLKTPKTLQLKVLKTLRGI